MAPSRARERLRLVTYNVWFGDHCRDERQIALLELLQAQDPDVVVLQEAAPELVEKIESTPWLKAYEKSELDVHPHGLLCLSRVPVRELVRHSLPSMFGRELLVAELEGLSVGIVHLESTRGLAEQRARQLRRIFPALARYTDAALMGDFNFCSSWDENAQLDPSYVDVWPHLRPQEPGWTEDTDVNRMRKELHRREKQVRFDRLLLRSTSWLPSSIELLGTEPISPEQPNLFPSDHFGLCVELHSRV